MGANSYTYQITNILILFTLVVKEVHCQSGDAVIAAIDQKGDRLNFIELANVLGLPVESYSIVTEDGYILGIYRIPGTDTRKPPILFLHAIEQAGDVWLLRGNASLPYVLSKRGHDLWFLSVRGSIYSRKHVTLDPDVDAAFWDFSFHEQAYYDTSVVIDVILNLTNSTSVNAIGFSLGNNIICALLATRPEYNSKINMLIALAPIVYLQNLGLPAAPILNNIDKIDTALKSLGVNEVLGYYDPLTKFLRNACLIPVFGYIVCGLLIIFPQGGIDLTEHEPSFFHITHYYLIVGTSRKNIVHVGQLGKNGIFRQYDYGATENMAVYNSLTPPVYNLTNVRIPVVIISGANDRVATVENVKRLRDSLPNVKQFTILPREMTNHDDLIWGRTMPEYLFPYILAAL